MCLKVLNGCGDDRPRFVSHYVEELPPVSFNHIDMSVLLGRMEQINNGICGMKEYLKLKWMLVRIFGQWLLFLMSGWLLWRNWAALLLWTLVALRLKTRPQQIAIQASSYSSVGQTQSPAWSIEVKEGHHLKWVPENSTTQLKLGLGQDTVSVKRLV